MELLDSSKYTLVSNTIHFFCYRLRPVVGGNIRGLDSPVVLDGYKIPKGVSCYCCTCCQVNPLRPMYSFNVHIARCTWLIEFALRALLPTRRAAPFFYRLHLLTKCLGHSHSTSKMMSTLTAWLHNVNVDVASHLSENG